MEEEIKQTPITPLPQEVIPEIPKKNSFKTILLVILGLLVVAGAVYAGFKMGKKQISPNVVAEPTITPQTTEASPTPDPTANWKTYNNKELGFSFQYPSSFAVTDTLQKSLKEIPTTHNILILEDKLSKQQFSFMINPDGFGPFFPDKTLNIAYSDSKGVYTIKDEDTENQENSDPDTYFIFISGKINSNVSFLCFARAPRNTQSQKEINQLTSQILSTFKFTNEDSIEGRFCGGIAANLPQNQCPEGYTCKLDGDYPDASGKCVKI